MKEMENAGQSIYSQKNSASRIVDIQGIEEDIEI